MDAYLELKASTGETGFYPVPEGSNVTSATATFRADGSPAAKILSALPDPGDGYEWYEYVEAGTSPTDFDAPITFTGANISDAGSTNTSVMTLTPRFENGEMRVTMTYSQPPQGGYQRWILYNNLGWFSQAQIEARGYAPGREHLFQCFDFVGEPHGYKRVDSLPNAEQRLTMF